MKPFWPFSVICRTSLLVTTLASWGFSLYWTWPKNICTWGTHTCYLCVHRGLWKLVVLGSFSSEVRDPQFYPPLYSLHVYFASLFLLSSCCQVTEYYTQVQRSLEVDPCNVISKKHKDWPRLLKIKIHYFQAVSHVSCKAGANNLVSFPGCDGLGMRLG